MRRVSIGIALLAAVVAAVLVWRCNRSETARSNATPTSSTSGSPSSVTSTRGGDVRPLPAWFVRKGAPKRSIAGRVTHDGKPVTGAIVTVHSQVTRAHAAEVATVRTSADGSFDLGLFPAGHYQVAATADGLASAIVNIDLSDPKLAPPSHQLELRLRDCTYFVEGTVVDAAGTGLPKASVQRLINSTPIGNEVRVKVLRSGAAKVFTATATNE